MELGVVNFERDPLRDQHCQNRCRIRFSCLSCRKQEEYRIAKGEEERDLYATEKKKSFESLEKVCGSFQESEHSQGQVVVQKVKEVSDMVFKDPDDSCRTRFDLSLWIPIILFSFSLACFHVRYLTVIFKGRMAFRLFWFDCSQTQLLQVLLKH